jgi:translation initiation factor IF-2
MASAPKASRCRPRSSRAAEAARRSSRFRGATERARAGFPSRPASRARISLRSRSCASCASRIHFSHPGGGAKISPDGPIMAPSSPRRLASGPPPLDPPPPAHPATGPRARPPPTAPGPRRPPPDPPAGSGPRAGPVPGCRLPRNYAQAERYEADGQGASFHPKNSPEAPASGTGVSRRPPRPGTGLGLKPVWPPSECAGNGISPGPDPPRALCRRDSSHPQKPGRPVASDRGSGEEDGGRGPRPPPPQVPRRPAP